MRAWIPAALLVLAAACATTSQPPAVAPPPQASIPTATPSVVKPIPTALPAPAPTPPVEPSAAVGAVDVPIRVLLERGRGPVVLRQPGRPYRVVTARESVWMWGPLEMSLVGGSAWQVGAWSNPVSAEEVVESLNRRFGPAMRVWSESTGTGLFRVRLEWTGGEPTDAGGLLATAGHADAFRISTGGAVRITGAAGSVESAVEIALTPAGDWPIEVSGRRYRGRLRLRIAGGDLLVINELGMEDYLRGVVPVEMGPYVFPELEALKAQTVAARTYAVAHLGDHDDEGWDICDTPACQAYHGAGAEHRLTDRAIEETAGLIAVFAAKPIDAMYTSTCGGHTEDAAELFDARGAPYLKGVVCAWERPLALTGEGESKTIGDRAAFRRFLALRALDAPDERVWPREALPAVARLCGGELTEVPREPGLEEWTEALLAAGGLDQRGPLASGTGAERLVGLADLFEIPLSPATPDAWDQGWHLEAISAVLEIQGMMVTETGEAVPYPGGVGIYPRRADASEQLSQPLPLLWRWDGSYTQTDFLEVLPGTRLERVRIGERTLAVVVVRSGGGGEADRRSAWRNWRREKRWDELEAGLGEPDLERIEIVRRGRSGRVVELAVIDGRGHRRKVTGFDVRRVLDLPETLFEMHLRTDADGERSAIFLGRGWGHGVGMCQNGAYGLARSGMKFEAILKHYYTGIEVTHWR